MGKRIAWCKENLLHAVTLFLLAFIPLYPKLPLIDIIRSWVYIRLEDFFIGLAILILGWIYIRNKQVPDSPLTKPITVYWIVGFISLVHALIFIFPHVPGTFAHLGILHYLRRIEYMAVCFLAFESFRKKRDVMTLIVVLASSYLLVILYGFGQKFFGFPAFLTMNEEFAKGIPLRLPASARFPSTFGGHYDLAAYLVLTIPIMGSMILGMSKLWQKALFTLFTFLGLIMLLFTSSRISFGVYLVVMSVMLWWQKKRVWIIPMIIASIVIMNFVSGVSERFYKTFRTSDVVIDLATGKPIGTLDKLDSYGALLAKGASPAEENLPTGSEYVSLGSVSSDQIKSVSLYVSKNVPGAVGEIATVSGSFLIQKALVYDISITTRFQGQWPRAVAAFKRNMLLGSGYSSLSVAADGDYHRMLGETGILGSVAFLGIFAVSFLIFIKRVHTLSVFEKSFVIGVHAGIVGLAINAVLIDVFEASKVAYTLWILQGAVIALLVAKRPFSLSYFSYLWKLGTSRWAYVFYLLLAVTILWGKTFSLYFLGDDFTWLKWAAQSNFSDIIGFFTNSRGFFYRPVPKLWYFILFSVFWLKPFAYHAMSIVLLLGTTFLVYLLLVRIGVKHLFSWFGALLFASLSVHHENIYWVSGQSSLLAGFFLLFGVHLLLISQKESRWTPVFIAASYLMVFASMLSYDGLIVTPFILVVLGLAYKKNTYVSVTYSVLIPLYLLFRTYAHALGTGGDYGYKATKMIANCVGNIIGYTVSLFGGPLVVEKWNELRVVVRPHLIGVTVLCVVALCVVWFIIKQLRHKGWFEQKSLVWIICYAIAFTLYIPLGGMAERYVYIPSIFFIVGLVIFLNSAWARMTYSIKGVVIVLFVSCLYMNVCQIRRVGNDWASASDVVDQTLRVIKKEAWPPQNFVHFYIINIPIRYGRAWIFPTGISDAIWHMYRQNPFDVTSASSIEEGYALPYPYGDRRVFIFDNLVLKLGMKIDQELK